MKKLFLLTTTLISLFSFAQKAKERQLKAPSSDTIYFPVERIVKAFSKKIGDTVGTDKITFKSNQPNDSIVQFVPRRFRNSVVTIHKFKDGSYTARITSKDVYYEWQKEGYFLKKPNPISEYNGQSMIAETRKLLESYFSIDKDSACVFFDFDGQTVTGTAWNFGGGPIVVSPSEYNGNTAQQDSIIRIAQEIVAPFPILVTRDSTKFFAAGAQRRLRIIFTPTYSWYGTAVAGVSYNYAFYWGDGTNSWVFDLFEGVQAKAVIAMHEFGHTIGMVHQNLSGAGSLEAGVRYIMYGSSSPQRNIAIWTKGTNQYGALQDDIGIFLSQNLDAYPGAKTVGLSLGDQGNSPNHARIMNKDQSITSIIGYRDSEYYRIFIPSTQTITITSTVRNEGSNTYASLDVALDLYSEAGTLIASSNNTTTLNATITQSLTKGYYIIKVRPNKNNTNNPTGYGFMGHCTTGYTF
jgi:hypothetical protein